MQVFVHMMFLTPQLKQNKFRERFKTEAPFSYDAVKPYTSLEKVSVLIFNV